MAGLYIHIPYCHSKCAYCDFYSSPLLGNMDKYVDALLNEYELRRNEITSPFTTIYIGGGTPSILPATLITRLVNELARFIDVSRLEEFTIEANPEDVTPQWVKTIKSLGITRVSMGIQSFNDYELKIINRRHSAQQAIQAIDTLREYGIERISGDLIYGLPEQDLKSWETSLNQLLSFRLPHFSAYLLSYEKGTGLYSRLMAGKVEEASEELVNEMYLHLIDTAKSHGYNHYEISNFAMPGSEAIHNTNYWRDLPYLGIGVAAHSFDGHNRRFNPSNTRKFITELSQHNCFFETEHEDETARHNDYIIISLRTSQGIDLAQYKQRFGAQAYSQLITNATPHLNAHQMRLTPTHLSINESSMLISDRIILSLII